MSYNAIFSIFRKQSAADKPKYSLLLVPICGAG